MNATEKYKKLSLKFHKEKAGKIEIISKFPLKNKHDLSIAYTPGVGAVSQYIGKDVERARTHTIKKNSIAVVSDGSAVLGFGNLGPLAALPVMEGKCALMKKFANVDAWPIVLDTQDSQEIIQTVKNIAPGFGGINLEDISAPRCFEIENALQDLGIPVFHDDQHGTAVVVLAALINAAKVIQKSLHSLEVVISGAGAAGVAISEILLGLERTASGRKQAYPSFVGNLIMVDTQGIISSSRKDLNPIKKDIVKFTNKNLKTGDLSQALVGADIFIGVSAPNILKAEDIRRMNSKPIVFALSNPVPEIMPDEAKKGGAWVVATGRSDFPNQVNNALVFPGIFRGALDAGVKRITLEMKREAAQKLAALVSRPKQDLIIPSVFDKKVMLAVSKAVKKFA